MTPQPPSNSDGSVPPPRHRLNMGNLAKDTTESDLWAFDEGGRLSEDATAKVSKPTPHLLPIPRESDKMKVRQLKDAVGTKFGGNMDRLNKPLPLRKSELTAQPSRPGSDFDDLDTWDEPVPILTATAFIPEAAAASVTPRAIPVTEIAHPQPLTVDENDEFSPPIRENAVSAPLRPRLNLSALERIGLVALLALLGAAGVVIFFLTIHRLPSKSEIAEANHYPVQGKHLTILSAASHWRAPRATDTVRRGTQLLPVLNLKASGGPAAVRVFFRNSEGELVGDAVTRSIKTGSELEVAATAGFDDVGMHAAYRNGLSKSWTIEVFEAPTENSAGSEFKKIFVMNISTDRR